MADIYYSVILLHLFCSINGNPTCQRWPFPQSNRVVIKSDKPTTCASCKPSSDEASLLSQLVQQTVLNDLQRRNPFETCAVNAVNHNHYFSNGNQIHPYGFIENKPPKNMNMILSPQPCTAKAKYINAMPNGQIIPYEYYNAEQSCAAKNQNKNLYELLLSQNSCSCKQNLNQNNNPLNMYDLVLRQKAGVDREKKNNPLEYLQSEMKINTNRLRQDTVLKCPPQQSCSKCCTPPRIVNNYFLVEPDNVKDNPFFKTKNRNWWNVYNKNDMRKDTKITDQEIARNSRDCGPNEQCQYSHLFSSNNHYKNINDNSELRQINSTENVTTSEKYNIYIDPKEIYGNIIEANNSNKIYRISDNNNSIKQDEILFRDFKARYPEVPDAVFKKYLKRSKFIENCKNKEELSKFVSQQHKTPQYYDYNRLMNYWHHLYNPYGRFEMFNPYIYTPGYKKETKMMKQEINDNANTDAKINVKEKQNYENKEKIKENNNRTNIIVKNIQIENNSKGKLPTLKVKMIKEINNNNLTNIKKPLDSINNNKSYEDIFRVPPHLESADFLTKQIEVPRPVYVHEYEKYEFPLYEDDDVDYKIDVAANPIDQLQYMFQDSQDKEKYVIKKEPELRDIETFTVNSKVSYSTVGEEKAIKEDTNIQNNDFSNNKNDFSIVFAESIPVY